MRISFQWSAISYQPDTAGPQNAYPGIKGRSSNFSRNFDGFLMSWDIACRWAVSDEDQNLRSGVAVTSQDGFAGSGHCGPVHDPPIDPRRAGGGGGLSAEFLPLIRMVRTQVVPFPLQVEAAPISAKVLSGQLVPLAAEFGAQVQICYARDEREGLLHNLRKESVVLIARANVGGDAVGHRGKSASPGGCDNEDTPWYSNSWRKTMLDVFYVAVGIAFFVIAWRMAKACDRL